MDFNPLEFMVRTLGKHVVLSEGAERAILQLPYTERDYDPSAYLIREGSISNTLCPLIVSGFAFRQKVTMDGARQIVAIHMRGDLLDLQQLFLNQSDHSVQALTRLKTINIERAALRKLILEEPSVGQAMWIEALVDASIYREWIVNIGRRSAIRRVAHLICEFTARSIAAGLSDGSSIHLPLTQEQLADATGLTSVHVNRTLKALATDGLIQRSKRDISLVDLERMRRAADFSEDYLHLNQPRSRPLVEQTTSINDAPY